MEQKKQEQKVNSGYYSVPNKPLSLSFATHPGELTREDVIRNLITAIEKSNELGEDWIADLRANWYQEPGMIMSTKPKEMLEDEKVIRQWAESLTDFWDIDGARAQAVLNAAGMGQELQPMNEELMEELMSDEADQWSLSWIVNEDLPSERPYF
jgi:hypothetical protein